jgi:hypothetical protein
MAVVSWEVAEHRRAGPRRPNATVEVDLVCGSDNAEDSQVSST